MHCMASCATYNYLHLNTQWKLLLPSLQSRGAILALTASGLLKSIVSSS